METKRTSEFIEVPPYYQIGELFVGRDFIKRDTIARVTLHEAGAYFSITINFTGIFIVGDKIDCPWQQYLFKDEEVRNDFAKKILGDSYVE